MYKAAFLLVLAVLSVAVSADNGVEERANYEYFAACAGITGRWFFDAKIVSAYDGNFDTTGGFDYTDLQRPGAGIGTVEFKQGSCKAYFEGYVLDFNGFKPDYIDTASCNTITWSGADNDRFVLSDWTSNARRGPYPYPTADIVDQELACQIVQSGARIWCVSDTLNGSPHVNSEVYIWELVRGY